MCASVRDRMCYFGCDSEREEKQERDVERVWVSAQTIRRSIRPFFPPLEGFWGFFWRLGLLCVLNHGLKIEDAVCCTNFKALS